MITVDESFEFIKSNIPQLGCETISIHDCLTRTLASDIYSPIDFPPFRASIMDGYALRSCETPGVLMLHKSIRAGEALIDLPKGSCIYITTGAAVPDLADAVIPIEEIKILEQSIDVPLCKPNQWIREVGSDIKQGEILGQKNDILTPQHIALLISVGITEIDVFKLPKIGIISTGNELKEIGDALNFGEIYDSNREMLRLLLKEVSNTIKDYGIIKDDYEEVRELMLNASKECDIIVTSGGVSMGDRDYVKPIIEEQGQIIFGRVNMKPGKPMTFGKIGNSLIFALPGNPVSCFVCFYLYVRYAIHLISNSENLPIINVKLEKTQKLDPRPEYHRAIVSWDKNQFIAISTGSQQSSRLLSTVKANAILIFPAWTSSKTHISGEVPAILLGPFSSIQPKKIIENNLTEKHFEKNHKKLSISVVSVSDRAFTKEYEDKTGVKHI